MKIILSHRLDLVSLPEPLLRKIRTTFTIENQAYLDNAKMNRWNGRTDHWLAALISPCGIETAILTGEVSNGSRKAIVERLNAATIKVLIATGQLIGEGLDCRGLSTLFLVTPIKFDGRLTQYLGPILRPAPGKDKAKVYDYVDVNVGVLVASAKARERVYDSF
jgi:superfamily II DNA or RNA helicase